MYCTAEIYKGVATSDKRLRAMVCYYGQHYTAYVQPSGQDQWYCIDDANQKPVPTFPFPLPLSPRTYTTSCMFPGGGYRTAQHNCALQFVNWLRGGMGFETNGGGLHHAAGDVG